MKYLFLAFFTLLSHPAFSAYIQGSVVIKESGACLEIQGYPQPFEIVIDPSILETSRLQTGDYISGDGALRLIDGRVYFSTVDSVGLKRLLGVWSSQNQELFHFNSFASLVYKPTTLTPLAQPEIDENKTYHYQIVPGASDSWTLILSNHKGVHIGQLNFVSGKINLKFVNTIGQVNKELILTPFSN